MRSRLTFQAAKIAGSLRCITPMGIINCTVKSTRGNDRFIDAYVITFPILPLLLFTLLPYIPVFAYLWPLAIWRIFEIIVYLLNSLLFDDYRSALNFEAPKPLAGVRRPLILLAFSYVELVFWFAYAYRLSIPALQAPTYTAWIEGVNFSFVALSAFGTSSLTAVSSLVTTLTLSEASLGLFMALAAVSRFVSLIPGRQSSDAVERRIRRRANDHSA